MDINIVARNLKKFLKIKKFSYGKLAIETGVHKNTVARYANGERFPDGEFIQQLILSYNLNANWLLTGKGEMLFENEQLFYDPEDYDQMENIEIKTKNERRVVKLFRNFSPDFQDDFLHMIETLSKKTIKEKGQEKEPRNNIP